MSAFYTVTTYGCREYLCRAGMIAGHLELQPVEPRLITVADIKRAVADHFSIPVSEMISARRAREAARPRQVAMYLSKRLTPRSLPAIGRMFGNRDHTTVIHAVRTIEKLRGVDRDLDADVRVIERHLNEDTKGLD